MSTRTINNEAEIELAIKNNRRSYIISEYYQAVNDESKIIRIDRERRIKEIVGKHIPRTYVKDYKTVMTPAFIDYRPDKNRVVFLDDNNQLIVNSYLPPKHLLEYYWNTKEHDYKETLTPEEVLSGAPPCYKVFFEFLFDEDKESIAYVIEWLSKALNSEKGRNLTALTLISSPGIGKGVLFEYVIMPLFGESNAAMVSGENAFVNQFNSQFAERQIIMLDEANLTTTEAINRFKTLVNNNIEVEKKGKDKYNTKNWLNILIASNNLNSVFIEEGDRRFSVVNMRSNQMLGDVFDVPELVKELSDSDNIKAFYEMLVQLKSSRDMNKVFKSARLEAIRDAGLKEWERNVLELINEKFDNNENIVLLKDVQTYLQMKGVKVVPGATKFKSLSSRFPNVFSVKQFKKAGMARGLFIYSKYDTSSFDKIDIDNTEIIKPNNVTKLKLGLRD